MHKRVRIEHMPAHVIWIMGLLETVTVPLVAGLPVWTGTALKNPLHGIFVGFAGVVILFYCISLALDRLNIFIFGKKVTGISIFSSAAWGGLLLLFIFIIQHALQPLIVFGYPFKEIILGFFSAGGAVACTAALYPACCFLLPFLKITIRTSEGMLDIRKFSLWRFALWAGTYEGIALPVILLWGFFPKNHIAVSIITGLIGGITGGATVWLAAQAKRVLPFLVFEYPPR